MKKAALFIFILFFAVNLAHAGYIIKTNPPASTTVAAACADQNTVAAEIHKNYNFIGHLKNWFHIPYRHREEGEGSQSMFWALLGLLIAPLGIFAVIHGINGMKSHSPMEQNRAFVGLVLGIAEVIVTIVFVAWFIVFFL